MTPEELLRPLLKKYTLPDSLVRLLFLLVQSEIETEFPSLAGADDPLLKLAQGLDHIFSKLPPIGEPNEYTFTTTLLELTGIDEADTQRLFKLRRPVELERKRHIQGVIERYEGHIHDVQQARSRVSRTEESEPYIDEADALIYRRKRQIKEYAQELKEPDPEPYLTPFWSRLLSFRVSYSLPEKLRFQHTHIIGVPGTGKSELIKRLVFHDTNSVVVMAPEPDLITDLAKLGGIWIHDWSNVGLNLLDLDPALIVYVFEALLESEPTPKQKAFLTQAVKQVKTLADFRALVSHTRGNYAETAEQIAWRLDLFPPVIEQVLSRETNLDIPSIMDGGRIFIDTSPLKTGSSLIGRFIIALIAQATKNRTSRTPCFVYIDEAQDYLTEYIEELLDQARKKCVGLILAHQNLSQLSTRLEQSILGTAIKFVGQVVPADASKLAPLLKLDWKDLTHLEHLSFVLYAHGFLPHPLRVKLKPGFLSDLPHRSREQPIVVQDAQPRPLTLSPEEDDDPLSKAPKC